MERGEAPLEPIADELILPYKTVEWNLKVLEKAGLVKRRIWGGIAHFSLSDSPDLKYNQAIYNIIKMQLQAKKK